MLVLGHEALQRVEGGHLRRGVGGAEPDLAEVRAGGRGARELGPEARDGEIVGVDLGVRDARQHLLLEGGFVVDAEAVDGDFARGGGGRLRGRGR